MGHVAKIAALTHCCFKVTENLICHAHLLVGQCVEKKFPSHLEEIVCSYSSSNVSHTEMHIFQCTFFYQCIIFFCCAILFIALLSFIKAMELPVFSSWYTLAVTCPFFAHHNCYTRAAQTSSPCCGRIKETLSYCLRNSAHSASSRPCGNRATGLWVW